MDREKSLRDSPKAPEVSHTWRRDHAHTHTHRQKHILYFHTNADALYFLSFLLFKVCKYNRNNFIRDTGLFYSFYIVRESCCMNVPYFKTILH